MRNPESLSYKTLSLLFRILFLIVLFISMSIIASAQTRLSEWSELNFVNPILEEQQFFPVIAADNYGNLHAMWHVNDYIDDPSVTAWTAHAIYYSVYNGLTWSEPVDVFADSDRMGVGIISDLIIVNDFLIAVRSQQGNIIVSSAPLNEASYVRSWSSIWIDRGNSPTLVISPDQSNMCLTYWIDVYQSLVYRCSLDYGNTWQEPMWVWSATSGSSGGDTDSVISQDNKLHIVWAEPTQRRNWNSEAIWHAVVDLSTNEVFVREVARSSSEGDPNVGQPVIIECPVGQMHILFNNAVGSRTGRFHQWFDTKTLAWSDVTPLFPGLSGMTGKAGVACDSAGRLHFLSAAAGDGRKGLRYAILENGVWSEYETLWKYTGEHPAATIVSNNFLYVLWDVYHITGQEYLTGIEFAYHVIDEGFVIELPNSTFNEPIRSSATPVNPPSEEIENVSEASIQESSSNKNVLADETSDNIIRWELMPLFLSVITVVPLVVFCLLKSHSRRR